MMISEDVEMITKIDNDYLTKQQIIEKCQILAYKTYHKAAIEESGIYPRENQVSPTEYACSGFLASGYRFPRNV